MGAEAYAPLLAGHHLPALLTRLRPQQPDGIRGVAMGVLAEISERMQVGGAGLRLLGWHAFMMLPDAFAFEVDAQDLRTKVVFATTCSLIGGCQIQTHCRQLSKTQSTGNKKEDGTNTVPAFISGFPFPPLSCDSLQIASVLFREL